MKLIALLIFGLTGTGYTLVGFVATGRNWYMIGLIVFLLYSILIINDWFKGDKK